MTLKVDRIENQTGSAGIPTDTVIEGSAKSWANLNGTGTIALRDSFNISSVVDNGTGHYTFNYTSSFSNVDYTAISGVAKPVSSNGATVCQALTDPTVSAFTAIHVEVSNILTDGTVVPLSIFGDLA